MSTSPQNIIHASECPCDECKATNLAKAAAAASKIAKPLCGCKQITTVVETTVVETFVALSAEAYDYVASVCAKNNYERGWQAKDKPGKPGLMLFAGPRFGDEYRRCAGGPRLYMGSRWRHGKFVLEKLGLGEHIITGFPLIKEALEELAEEMKSSSAAPTTNDIFDGLDVW